MNESFFANNFQRKLLKKWASSQTSILIDQHGTKYIEKEENQVDKNGETFIIPYGSDELEIYQKMLVPLKVEHVNVVASVKKYGSSRFVLEYVEGFTCSDNPSPIHLYLAAFRIGDIYNISRKNMHKVKESVFEKYLLSKEKMLNHLYEISKSFDMSELICFVHDIYQKYSKRPVFLNHYDMHFKNMIYSNNDIHIIDWATAQLSPFFSDLYVLLRQAEEVCADSTTIIENFKKTSGLAEITEEEILVGTICWCIPAIHWLLDLQGTDDVPFYEWAEDEYTSLLNAFHRYKEITASVK